MSDETDCTSVPPLGGCSALAVTGGRSAIGEPVIVRNFDYIEPVRPLYSMRQSRPNGGFESLDFTLAPFPGTIDGINEKGLCITYNYAYATDRRRPSAPISIVIADALQRCGSVVEAVSRITSRPRWGAGILMLADAGGEIASLELSSTRAQLRTPGPGENALFHTNTFWTDSMREVQVHDDAVYSGKAPVCLRGGRLHESAVKRTERFKNLLGKIEPLDLEALGAIMGDHGSAKEPSSSTICMHGPYWTTTASLQLFPKSRRMRVAFDSACRARYAEVAL